MAPTSDDQVLTYSTLSDNSSREEVTCELFDGNQSKCDALTYTHIVVGSFSLAACTFILLIQWLYRRYTVFVQRLILYLTVVSAFACVIKILGDKPLHNHSFCIFQAWAWQFSSWSTLIWILCITFHLFMNTVFDKSTEKFEWFHHVVGWVLPFIISVFPLIGHTYGPAGAWCWVIDRWEWRFGIWYIPFVVMVTILIGVYTYIIYKINVKTKSYQGHFDPHTEQRRLMLMAQVIPLRIYPLIYLLCGVFPLIDRIYNVATNDVIFALKIMHAISNPLQGALFALAFCLDKDTIDKLHWTQLKLAFRQRCSGKKAIIREYQTNDMSFANDTKQEVTSSSI